MNYWAHFVFSVFTLHQIHLRANAVTFTCACPLGYIDCGTEDYCQLICSTSGGCKDIIIECPPAPAYCDIECSGETDSCNNVTLIIPVDIRLRVICDDWNSTKCTGDIVTEYYDTGCTYPDYWCPGIGTCDFPCPATTETPTEPPTVAPSLTIPDTCSLSVLNGTRTTYGIMRIESDCSQNASATDCTYSYGNDQARIYELQQSGLYFRGYWLSEKFPAGTAFTWKFSDDCSCFTGCQRDPGDLTTIRFCDDLSPGAEWSCIDDDICVWGSFDEYRLHNHVNYPAPGNVLKSGEQMKMFRDTILAHDGMEIGAMATTLTSEYLNSIDVFFTGALAADAQDDVRLSTNESQALVSWVENGGILIVSADRKAYDMNYRSFTTLFGIAGEGFLETAVIVSTPVVNTTSLLAVNMTSLTFANNGGSTFSVENPDADIVFEDADGDATVVVLKDIKPGFGDVIVVGDANVFMDIDNPVPQLMENVATFAQRCNIIPTPLLTPSPIPLTTLSPTAQPTITPTREPTTTPTSELTTTPTAGPTSAQTPIPTTDPTTNPTDSPTLYPTLYPVEETEEEETEGSTEDGSVILGDIEGELIKGCELFEETLSFEIGEVADKHENCNAINKEPEGNGASKCNVVLNIGGTMNQTENIEIGIQGYNLDDVSACFPVQDEFGDFVSQIVDIELNSGNLSEFVTFTVPYQPKDVECGVDIQNDGISCTWYDAETLEWTSEGCEVAERDVELDGGRRGIACKCNHLTAFAIIQDTIAVKDECNRASVFGHPLWIVFAALYSILWVCVCIRLYSVLVTYFTTGDQRKSKLIIHVLIFAIATLNIVLTSILYSIEPSKASPAMFYLLAVVWAALYILTYWTYAFVVATWANIVVETEGKRTKNIFIRTGVLLSLVILIMFISTGIVGGETLKDIVFVGSVIVSIVCGSIAIGFLIYGSLLVRKLQLAGRFVDDPNQASQYSKLSRNIVIGLGLTSLAFLVQAILLLVSATRNEIFFANFAALQSCFMMLDIVVLFTVLFLFFIGNKERTRGSTVSRRRISLENSCSGHSQDVEMPPRQV